MNRFIRWLGFTPETTPGSGRRPTSFVPGDGVGGGQVSGAGRAKGHCPTHVQGPWERGDGACPARGPTPHGDGGSDERWRPAEGAWGPAWGWGRLAWPLQGPGHSGDGAGRVPGSSLTCSLLTGLSSPRSFICLCRASRRKAVSRQVKAAPARGREEQATGLSTGGGNEPGGLTRGRLTGRGRGRGSHPGPGWALGLSHRGVGRPGGPGVQEALRGPPPVPGHHGRYRRSRW